MSVVGHVRRFWRFHSLIAIALSLSALTLGCAVKEPAFYEGTWVITEAHGAGMNTAPSTQDKNQLGRSLYYAKDNAKLSYHQCNAPHYNAQPMKLKDFSERYHLDGKKLRFHSGTITEVTLECKDTDADVGSILVYQEDTLAYTVFDGTFYRIEKSLEVAPI